MFGVGVGIGVGAGSFQARSSVLIANAWHHRSDAFSSMVAIGGISGVMLGQVAPAPGSSISAEHVCSVWSTIMYRY